MIYCYYFMQWNIRLVPNSKTRNSVQPMTNQFKQMKATVLYTGKATVFGYTGLKMNFDKMFIEISREHVNS